MKKFLVMLAIIFAGNFFTANVHAEIKNYSGRGAALLDFVESNAETTETAKNIAKLRAIKKAFEKAGFSVLSFVEETLHGRTTSEYISAIVRDMATFEDEKIDKYFFNSEEYNRPGYIYEANLIAKIDTEKIAKYFQLDAGEKQKLIERDQTAKKNFEEIDSDFENLRKNADKKTPEQIKSELEKIDNKISEQNKPADQKNIPMIFSQPVKIGFAGVPPYAGQSPYYKGGFFFEGTSHNEGSTIPQGRGGIAYRKGLAHWGEGKDALYCEYNYRYGYSNDDLKFGGKNNFLVSDRMGRYIFKIDTNKGITLYELYYRYKQFVELDIIGHRPDGTWVKYIDMRQIDEKYFGKYPRSLEVIFGTEGWGDNSVADVTYRQDTIIVPYHVFSYNPYRKIQAGEFRFKWDDAAQWFGIEQIKY